jgi:hypothetical protein
MSPYGFQATHQLQRPALLDVAGNIFIGFGFGTSNSVSNETNSVYEGWMAQYNSCATNSSSCPSSTCFTSTNCQFYYTTSSTPAPLAGQGAGVWMSGAGPSSDGTYFAFSTGNACTPSVRLTEKNCPAVSGNDLGDSVIYGPAVVGGKSGSTFTPEATFENPLDENYYVDDYNDLDVSSGGVLMIPPAVAGETSSYLLASGKAGQTYLLPTSDLGGYTSTPYQGFLSATGTSPCVPPFPVSPQKPLYGGIIPYAGGCPEIHDPAFWSLEGGGFYMIWGFSDVPRGYYFDGAKLETTPSSQFPPISGPAISYGGGALAVSSNGNNPNSAILWAVTSNGFSDTGVSFGGGALQAFQLYSSAGQYEIASLYNSQSANLPFTAVRYVSPIVNNGKVYVTAQVSGDGRIFVYGPCSDGPGGVCGTQP